VLPIPHLNKIANRTILARIEPQELDSFLQGCWWAAGPVGGRCIGRWPEVIDAIAAIQQRARRGSAVERPRWPMIVLRSPKGWT
jgi:xylulose-5-phosphate/fructose-6-phosphate phosphoketolase